MCGTICVKLGKRISKFKYIKDKWEDRARRSQRQGLTQILSQRLTHKSKVKDKVLLKVENVMNKNRWSHGC